MNDQPVAAGNDLLTHLDQIHTTPLGACRIRRNLSLTDEDVAAWCIKRIVLPTADISRAGKNWYIAAEGCVITVNAYSYTIITAHRSKPRSGGTAL